MTKFNDTMLQQISDVAWLVHRGSEKLGILNKSVQDNFTYLNGTDLIHFKNKTEVVKHFGNVKLFEQQITNPIQKQDKFYVKGHEVDYSEPFALEESSPDYRYDLPLYTKIPDSKIYYAAGYYCINFEKGWKHARGPKLTTLEKYGYEGPFKTEIEMKQRLKTLNKVHKNKQKII